ncbi:unnamed protein product [Echinostoma caproni]|uniref:Mannose-1-phosphate guanylyltransferase n=1 Tax=Echinostoma caproni TaxID=27848 RepID=A0A183AUI8_9TREM|nr:unnamed protein product [Echinostoma caproni]
MRPKFKSRICTNESETRVLPSVWLSGRGEEFLGPNVSIGERAVIRGGVRLRDCIVLRDAEIRAHACCLNAVIGWNTIIGEWARVEGTPNDPNPNKPFTKLDVLPVFNAKGQLNPSITVIGSNVEVPPEVIVLNCIVLPHKELSHSSKNQIIL